MKPEANRNLYQITALQKQIADKRIWMLPVIPDIFHLKLQFLKILS